MARLPAAPLINLVALATAVSRYAALLRSGRGAPVLGLLSPVRLSGGAGHPAPDTSLLTPGRSTGGGNC